MSRRPKLDYDFCPLPRKRHPAWAGVSLHMKGLMLSLFELADGAPITTSGNWLDSLCKQMQIDGRDRPNVRKSLLDLQSKGVLVVSQEAVSVAFFPHVQVTPVDVPSTSGRRPLDVPSTSPQPPLDIPLESTTRNDSGHKSQTDRQTDKKDIHTTARAPERAKPVESGVSLPDWTDREPPLSAESPEVIGCVWYRELLGRDGPPLHTCRRDYAWIGSQKAADRLQVARNVRATTWAASNISKVTTSHVVRFWASYLEGPRNGPQQVMKVSPKDQAYTRMKECEKAYREAERYGEPTDALMAKWQQATKDWSALPVEARAS